MTGYEPMELKRMMRDRLHLYTRKLNTKGSFKITWSELLVDKEEKIIEYVTNPTFRFKISGKIKLWKQ